MESPCPWKKISYTMSVESDKGSLVPCQNIRDLQVLWEALRYLQFIENR